MKQTLHTLFMLVFLVGVLTTVRGQKAPAQNIVIFLMDGYRWEELYRGADSALMYDNKYNRTDSVWTFKKYWAPDAASRRKLLMPFVWETIATQGQLYGNRDLGSLVNVRNLTGNLTALEKEANTLQHMLPDIFGGGERMDAGTFALAKAYLLANHPRVLYIDLGDPDDFGHAGDYGDYLDAAHDADAMFRDIWNYLQHDDFYKGKTAMVFFPDHGRGLGPEWTSHGEKIGPSGETYFMALGAGVPFTGEVHGGSQIYEQQYAQTIAHLLGLNFMAEHPVAEGIELGVR